MILCMIPGSGVWSEMVTTTGANDWDDDLRCVVCRTEEKKGRRNRFEFWFCRTDDMMKPKKKGKT